MDPFQLSGQERPVFFIMKKYVGTFELLAIKYVNMAMDALEREDYEKFVDIKQNPLKYVLKENKDVPPVPEGYI